MKIITNAILLVLTIVSKSRQQILKPIRAAPPIPILRFDSRQISPMGAYSFSYETGNGISVHESGTPKGSDILEVVGGYSYTSPEGVPINVEYIANEDGFQANTNRFRMRPALPTTILKSIPRPQQPAQQALERRVPPTILRPIVYSNVQSQQQELPRVVQNVATVKVPDLPIPSPITPTVLRPITYDNPQQQVVEDLPVIKVPVVNNLPAPAPIPSVMLSSVVYDDVPPIQQELQQVVDTLPMSMIPEINSLPIASPIPSTMLNPIDMEVTKEELQEIIEEIPFSKAPEALTAPRSFEPSPELINSLSETMLTKSDAAKEVDSLEAATKASTSGAVETEKGVTDSTTPAEPIVLSAVEPLESRSAFGSDSAPALAPQSSTEAAAVALTETPTAPATNSTESSATETPEVPTTNSPVESSTDASGKPASEDSAATVTDVSEVPATQTSAASAASSSAALTTGSSAAPVTEPSEAPSTKVSTAPAEGSSAIPAAGSPFSLAMERVVPNADALVAPDAGKSPEKSVVARSIKPIEAKTSCMLSA